MGTITVRLPMLTVNEIFYSIQGESSFTGRPCVFVRLTACDLRCTWCDTPYAFHEGTKRTVDQVADEVLQIDCPLVELTGGEPLLQPDVYDLMERLIAAGRTVLLETGGHVGVERVPAGVVKVVDVKCPASGESSRNRWENLALLRGTDEVKFVIQDRADYEYARDVLRRHDLASRTGEVLFSPVHGVLPLITLAEWVLEDALPVRVQPQLHKYIWAPDRRGV
jgi:7-carboxy-7-deazaguanine synthase